MKFQLYAPQAIHQLGKRKNQEDTIYPLLGKATADDRLFLVCDGMGGHDKGEVASDAVCQGMTQALADVKWQDTVLTDKQFEAALAKAFDSLDAADTLKEGKMGTTMTFLCLHKGGCLVAHIGDSRIYHLRPQENKVLYRSRDHSLVQQLYELGEISYNEMGTSQRKNIILKAMQPFQEERSKATLVHITDIRPGDYFYLCSDGMLEQMEDDEILSILRADTTDQEKADELIRRTTENADNHSAYLIHIKDVEPEPGDEQLESDEEEARRKNKALNDTRKDEVWDDVSRPVPAAVAVEQPKAAVASAGKKKNYLWVLVLLLVAIAAIVVLLLTGKDKKDVDDDLDDEPAVEQTTKEDDSSSVKDEVLQEQLKSAVVEPDMEPQPLQPQPQQKEVRDSKFGFGNE